MVNSQFSVSTISSSCDKITSAIGSNVAWRIANYTDATARQYLIDTYHWTINAGNFDGSKTIKGNNNANTLHTTATKTTLHGLGGNEVLSILFRVIALALNIPVAFFKLEISQLPIFWLKAPAL
jgi:hypothetical protein